MTCLNPSKHWVESVEGRKEWDRRGHGRNSVSGGKKAVPTAQYLAISDVM